jgi:hypothetical protein
MQNRYAGRSEEEQVVEADKEIDSRGIKVFGVEFLFSVY